MFDILLHNFCEDGTYKKSIKKLIKFNIVMMCENRFFNLKKLEQVW